MILKLIKIITHYYLFIAFPFIFIFKYIISVFLKSLMTTFSEALLKSLFFG